MADPQTMPEVLRGQLKAARALIDSPDKWSGNGWGEDGRRCAVHALSDATGRDVAGERHPSYMAIFAVVDGAVGNFNDRHTHAEVLAVFDTAIANVEIELETLEILRTAEAVPT